ncbi:hypothetical protein TNIN_242971 [Trichonephila inaurata madagascariensis]|uniref:Uncharacterized protein n=1 Tax=Trichonephila inaurata madagascariensis TaxID=2747483 RepID=A0A8X7BQ78_9ARAC|nr:hypothetical protein TNIN_242971 [Trichonephila inaurata madagascariensis]
MSQSKQREVTNHIFDNPIPESWFRIQFFANPVMRGPRTEYVFQAMRRRKVRERSEKLLKNTPSKPTLDPVFIAGIKASRKM